MDVQKIGTNGQALPLRRSTSSDYNRSAPRNNRRRSIIMKTYLALAAAALLATSGGALAKSTTAVISLDGHCDVITLQIDKPLVAGAGDPDCAVEYGGGMIGKVKGFGNSIVAGVQTPNAPGAQFVLQLSYPLVTG